MFACERRRGRCRGGLFDAAGQLAKAADLVPLQREARTAELVSQPALLLGQGPPGRATKLRKRLSLPLRFAALIEAPSDRLDHLPVGAQVNRSLAAALWAFHDAKDFREAVLRAVNLGDDADTTGAVCGQFAGTYWGQAGIPVGWLEGLARRDMIEDALTRLGAAAKMSNDKEMGDG
jgi:hypothetical protein